MAQCAVGLVGCYFTCGPFACPSALPAASVGTALTAVGAAASQPATVNLVLSSGNPQPGDTITGTLTIDTGTTPLGAYNIRLDCDAGLLAIMSPLSGGAT